MATDTTHLVPDFITFLFSSKPKFDCYFKVGNIRQGKQERIGAVKLMLMAHSEVFRLELEDSELKDKENVPIPDIHPDTFKGMLKYVYGHDTTSDMSFDEADNLLYVAEKYMMKTLKDKLATRLMKLLKPDNICTLLNNPACYTHLQLDAAITDILRYETDHVLASPQFLWMNTDGFLKILQQDGLAVAEIDLWRAAIKWAKHRANTEEGTQLRGQLCGLTQHLRICTLTLDELAREVAITDVLSNNEIGAVITSLGKKEKPQGMSEFSDEIQPRKLLQGRNKGIPRNKLSLVNFTKRYWRPRNVYKFTLLTKQSSIELLPLICHSRPRSNMDPENWTYKVNCTTTITKVANPYKTDSSSTNDPPTTVSFTTDVKLGVEFEIPLAVDGRNVTLQPDTQYSIEINIDGDHQSYSSKGYGIYSNDHLALSIKSNSNRIYYFPSDKLQYRVVT